MIKIEKNMKISKYAAFALLILTNNGYSQCLSNQQCLNLNYSDGSVNLPLALENAMTIDSNSGDINVSTTLAAEAIGTQLGLQPVGNTPVISFGVSLNGDASAATISATISEEAVYCQKAGLWGTAISTANPPLSFVTSIWKEKFLYFINSAKLISFISSIISSLLLSLICIFFVFYSAIKHIFYSFI